MTDSQVHVATFNAHSPGANEGKPDPDDHHGLFSALRGRTLQIGVAWRRCLARAIDAAMVNVAFNVIYGLVMANFVQLPWMLLAVAGSVVHLIAEAACLSRFGNTPGKRMVGLKIVSILPGPTPIPALSRSLRVWAMGSAAGIPGLSTLASAWFGYQLHKAGTSPWDHACHTRVVFNPDTALI